MKQIFLYRIKKAEKPSKFEKKLRKVAMWFVIDVVVIAVAVTLFQEALNSSYHVEITRWDASQEPELGKLMADPQGKGKDGVSVEEGEVSPDPLLTIKKVAEEEGVDWKVIYAICKKETGCNPNIKCAEQFGHCDNGNSFGAYQINRPAHPTLAVGDMENFEWSTRWTAQRIKAKSDKWGIDLAVMLHNGNPRLPQVQAYLADVNRIIASL